MKCEHKNTKRYTKIPPTIICSDCKMIWKNLDSKEVMQLIAEEKAEEEEAQICEKCGGEVGSHLVGDESHDICIDCGWENH